MPRQRTTAYGEVPADRRAASFNAPELAPIVQTAPRKRATV
jgi:FO synthase